MPVCARAAPGLTRPRLGGSSQIGDLVHLAWLSLSLNRLVVLPPEIGNLTQLTLLNLENNELTALPPQIGNADHEWFRELYDGAGWHVHQQKRWDLIKP